jgi:hypothetical protein
MLNFIKYDRRRGADRIIVSQQFRRSFPVWAGKKINDRLIASYKLRVGIISSSQRGRFFRSR